MALRNKLMVINAGSSSLKFKLFQMGQAGEGGALSAIASGVCERVGDPSASFLRAKANGSEESKAQHAMPDHTSALGAVAQYLSSAFTGDFTKEVHGVGHRVVHGRHMSQPALISAEVRSTIEQAADLAPLHNPPNLMGIDAALQTFAGVAVFDTAFHQTMPPAAFMYALPYELYTERAIRRYGFHGTSYNVDTSMGLTPLEGLMMGTRCGDIDPAITSYLAAKGMSPKEIDQMMNKKSGFLGLAGNADLRNHAEARFGPHVGGDAAERSRLAVDVYIRRVRKYLGAYFVHLDGQVDAIVFSAGIGENSAPMRREFCRGMEFAGVKIDEVKNEGAGVGKAADVAAADSRVRILVLPTDEELSIAQQTVDVIAAASSSAAAA
ncbi:Acetate kinase [Chlorella vulgaris]